MPETLHVFVFEYFVHVQRVCVFAVCLFVVIAGRIFVFVCLFVVNGVQREDF